MCIRDRHTPLPVQRCEADEAPGVEPEGHGEQDPPQIGDPVVGEEVEVERGGQRPGEGERGMVVNPHVE